MARYVRTICHPPKYLCTGVPYRGEELTSVGEENEWLRSKQWDWRFFLPQRP